MIKLLRLVFGIGGRLWPAAAAHAARRLLMTPRRYPLPAAERQAEVRARRCYFGAGLSALHWGRKGPLVLCVHGWEGRATQFAPYVEPLLAAGYQVLALDAPAHGHSAGRQSHPLLFVHAIVEAGRAFGPVDMVIGHSMGAGAVSIALSRGLRARRAVLIAGPSSLHKVLLRFAWFIGLPEPARRHFLALVERYTDAPLDTVEIRSLARDFSLPALIVHDHDDRMMPFGDAEEVAANWPDSHLFATSGSGHHRVINAPEVVAAVVAFAGKARGLAQAA